MTEPIQIFVVQRHDPNSSDPCEAVAAYGTRDEAVDGIEIIAREELSGFDEQFCVAKCLREGSKFSDYLTATADVWFDVIIIPLHAQELRWK